MRFVSVLAVFGILLSTTVSAQTGNLKLRVVYGGDKAPILPVINPDKDQQFCGKHKIPDESILVNPENKGLQNALVFVYTGARGGTKLKNIPAGKMETKVLDNKGCLFEPHVLLLQAGDTLQVLNSDDIGHNANLNFLENKAENPLIPPKGKHSAKMEKGEPGLVKVECNIHPWMRAYVLIQDHPYAAISDKDGNVVIKDLPAEKLVFRFMHESAKKYDGITVGGKPADWKKNNFEITIKPGENDLGEIVVPAANF